MSKTETFINKIAKTVVSEVKRRGFGVPSAIIAQAALESGWGESSLAKRYFNFFGMKCGMYWKGRSVNLRTNEEYTPGTYTNIMANFRVYDDIESGVDGYFDFISTGRYAAVRAARDYKTYITELKKAGYATSSNYIKNLCNVVEKYDLTKYDDVKYDAEPKPKPKPQVHSTKVVKASKGARSFDKSIAGTYKTTSDLKLRDGAGLTQKVLAIIPDGTEVKNYGYYTNNKGIRWMYIVVTIDGVEYTGFSSGNYLAK